MEKYLIDIFNQLRKFNYFPSNSLSCLVLTLNYKGIIVFINLIEFLLEYLTYGSYIKKARKYFDVIEIKDSINYIKKNSDTISPFIFSKNIIITNDNIFTDFNKLFDMEVNKRNVIIKKYFSYFKDIDKIDKIYLKIYMLDNKKQGSKVVNLKCNKKRKIL